MTDPDEVPVDELGRACRFRRRAAGPARRLRGRRPGRLAARHRGAVAGWAVRPPRRHGPRGRGRGPPAPTPHGRWPGDRPRHPGPLPPGRGGSLGGRTARPLSGPAPEHGGTRPPVAGSQPSTGRPGAGVTVPRAGRARQVGTSRPHHRRPTPRRLSWRPSTTTDNRTKTANNRRAERAEQHDQINAS